MSVIAWLLILTGGVIGLFTVVALLGIAVGHAAVHDLPQLSGTLLAFLGVLLFLVGLGQSLRKQRAWAWDATMAVLITTMMLVGIPPLWYIDAGRGASDLIAPFAYSAVALAALSYAMRVCASGPVRAAFLPSAPVHGTMQPAGVRVIAAIQWMTAAGYLLEIFADGQTWVFGYPVNFFVHVVRCILFALLAGFVAVGLYRMMEIAWSSAIGFILMTLLDSTAWAIVAPTTHGGFSWVRLATVTWSLIFSAVTIWYLIARRDRFRHESAPVRTSPSLTSRNGIQ